MMLIWISLGVLVVAGFFGWRAGVVKRLIELAGMLLAVLVTARFASGLAPRLSASTDLNDTTALIVAYVALFVVALIIVRFTASLVAKFVQWTPLGWLDRIGGAVCGAALGALVISVCLMAVSQIPGGQKLRASYTSHPVGEVIYYAAPSIYQGVHRLLGGRTDDLWRRAVETADKAEDKAREALDDR